MTIRSYTGDIGTSSYTNCDERDGNYYNNGALYLQLYYTYKYCDDYIIMPYILFIQILL